MRYIICLRNCNGLEVGQAPHAMPITESLFVFFNFICAQIPETKIKNSSVNAVLVDKEAVGSVDASGCGAKILCGDGELERVLHETKSKDFMVSSCSSLFRSVFAQPQAPSLSSSMSLAILLSISSCSNLRRYFKIEFETWLID